MPCTALARVRQRRGSRVTDGPVGLANGALPAEERVAHEGHPRDDRVRAYGSAWHDLRDLVCDWRRVKRGGDRAGRASGSCRKAQARTVVWACEA